MEGFELIIFFSYSHLVGFSVGRYGTIYKGEWVFLLG